jgi:flagellar biosynthesis protein FliR
VTLRIDSTLLVGYVLAMARAGAWLAIAPPFGGTMVPARIKAGFAAALALALGPRLAEQSVPLEVGPLIGAMLLQVAAGAALGFLAYLLFAAFQTAGSVIDIFGAFSIAQAIDPVSGIQTSVFGRFYSLVASVLLFATGGHLLLVRGFLTSFEALPVDGFRSERIAEVLTADLSTFFVAALQIAAPLVAALFLTDVALGLLSRAAPEMNVFLLGLPLKIFITISLVSVAIPVLPGAVGDLTDTAVRHGLGLGG